MEKRIIYKWSEIDPITETAIDRVAVIIPARFEDCGLTVVQIAAKDVPTGLPYKIVDVSDIPTDRSQRAAWSIDESELTDGVGA